MTTMPKTPSAVTRDYIFEVDRSTDGQGAAALDLRRQDHHLPQARRARPRPAETGFPRAWATPGPPSATLPGGEMPGADFERWLDGEVRARHDWLPGRRGATIRKALWHQHQGPARRRQQSIADLGRHFGGAAL